MDDVQQFHKYAIKVHDMSKSVVKKYFNPCRAYQRPSRCQNFEVSTFLGSRHKEVLWLSALHTGRLYPEIFLVLAESNPGT